MASPSTAVFRIIDVQGFNAIRFGGGRTKDYALTGSVGYLDYSGKDTLAIQGGGATTATRTVDMWAEAGFRLHGMQMIEGSQTIELGYGVTGKEGSAGKIGYGTFTGAGLDIVGAGQTANQRWIVMHGAITVNGLGQFGRTPLYVGGYKFDAANRAISLQAEQSIAAVSFVQSSDRRIKDIVGVSSSQKDIENLRKIRVTDYRLKTVLNVNQPVVKGVIAQEVETVLPSAIGKGSNIIPCDRIAAAAIGWKSADKPFSLKMESDHGLAVGQEIRVEADGVPANMAVRSVIDARTIEVGGMSFSSEPKSVALVGREVKDFLSVDYQQIYMTAVSALQEVDRRVQELEKREARVVDLEKKAARVETLERDLAELRKMVVSMGAAAGKGQQAAVGQPGAGAVASSR